MPKASAGRDEKNDPVIKVEILKGDNRRTHSGAFGLIAAANATIRRYWITSSQTERSKYKLQIESALTKIFGSEIAEDFATALLDGGKPKVTFTRKEEGYMLTNVNISRRER